MRICCLALLAVAALCGVAPVASASTTHTLRADASLKTTSGKALEFWQSGAVRTSLGAGTMTLHSKISRGRVNATFTVRLNGATVYGSATGKVSLGQRIGYVGTAKILRGTGRYRNVRGTGLRYTGSAPLNGRSAQIQLRGVVRY